METAIFSSNSKADLDLLVEIAKKMNIQINKLSSEQIEEIGLLMAMQEGKNQDYVPVDEVLRELKEWKD